MKHSGKTRKHRVLKWIAGLLAAPSNGTTAYDMHEDPSFDEAAIEIPEKYLKSGGMTKQVKIRPFYLEMVQRIAGLNQKG